LFLVPTVLRGRHERSPGVRIVATRRFTILTEDANAPLVLWADGERLGATPATVEVVPGAIAVMLNAAP
jgi:diacylglycerol kinase family enzyme